MDVRLLAESCFHNLSSCINNTPDSVLYCLTIHEVIWTSQVNRLVRCLSHSDFSLTLQNAEKLLDEGSCSRRKMLSCDCPTCKSSSKLFQSNEPESSNNITTQPPTMIKVTETSSMSMNYDYEPPKQSEAKAEKELIESVNNQITRKPEIKTANMDHCSITYILFSIFSCLILLNLCH